MGAVLSLDGSSAEVKRSREWDLKLELLAEDAARACRVLVVGPPGGGKKTLVKQLKALEGRYPLKEAYRRELKGAMHRMAVRNARALLALARRLGTAPAPGPAAVVDAAPGGDDAPLTPALAAAISQLWAGCAATRGAWAARARAPGGAIDDGAWWVLDKVATIAEPGWAAGPEDDVYARVLPPAGGLAETRVWVENIEYVFLDVSAHDGTDRRKWIEAFDEVVAVIFVASLADFERPVPGGGAGNALIDGVLSWAELVNMKHFDEAAFFLVLNKRDLLEARLRDETLRSVPRGGRGGGGGDDDDAHSTASTEGGASTGGASRGGAGGGGGAGGSRFSDFTGGKSFFGALQYVTDRFLELSRRPPDRAPAVHITTATDADAVRPVVRDIRLAMARHAQEVSVLREGARGAPAAGDAQEGRAGAAGAAGAAPRGAPAP